MHERGQKSTIAINVSLLTAMKQYSECASSVWINAYLKRQSYPTEKQDHPHSVDHGSVDSASQLESDVGRSSAHIFDRAMSTADGIKSGKTERTRASVWRAQLFHCSQKVTEGFQLLHKKANVMGGAHLLRWCSSWYMLCTYNHINKHRIFLKIQDKKGHSQREIIFDWQKIFIPYYFQLYVMYIKPHVYTVYMFNSHYFTFYRLLSLLTLCLCSIWTIYDW